MKWSCILLWMAVVPVISAQHEAGLSASFISSFNAPAIVVGGEKVEEKPGTGYILMALYRYNTKLRGLSVAVEAGYKQQFLAGTRGTSEYRSTTFRFVGGAGVYYQVLPRGYLSALAIVENNRDLEDFRTQTTDNLRYSVRMGAGFDLNTRFSIFTEYTRALYPRVAHYLLFNPAHQLGLGVQYRLL